MPTSDVKAWIQPSEDLEFTHIVTDGQPRVVRTANRHATIRCYIGNAGLDRCLTDSVSYALASNSPVIWPAGAVGLLFRKEEMFLHWTGRVSAYPWVCCQSKGRWGCFIRFDRGVGAEREIGVVAAPVFLIVIAVPAPQLSQYLLRCSVDADARTACWWSALEHTDVAQDEVVSVLPGTTGPS